MKPNNIPGSYKFPQIVLACILFISLTLAALVNMGNAWADAYLDALQQESDQTPYLQAGGDQAETETTAAAVREFETMLKGKDEALYTVYRNLSTSDRQLVHRIYTGTSDYDKVEQLIHELHIAAQQ